MEHDALHAFVYFCVTSIRGYHDDCFLPFHHIYKEKRVAVMKR